MSGPYCNINISLAFKSGRSLFNMMSYITVGGDPEKGWLGVVVFRHAGVDVWMKTAAASLDQGWAAAKVFYGGPILSCCDVKVFHGGPILSCCDVKVFHGGPILSCCDVKVFQGGPILSVVLPKSGLKIIVLQATRPSAKQQEWRYTKGYFWNTFEWRCEGGMWGFALGMEPHTGGSLAGDTYCVFTGMNNIHTAQGP